jgi:hypothetical protein
MDTTPRPRGPSGSDLLAGTPEAEAYCRSLAPAVFPDGVPSPELAARVADAIWCHLREHPGTGPVIWNPQVASAQRISAELGMRVGYPPPHRAFRTEVSLRGALVTGYTAVGRSTRLALSTPAPDHQSSDT